MTELQLLKKIGSRIKQLREEKGFSQDRLGAEMKLDNKRLMEYDKSNISRLESGKTNPQIFTLYRIAKALDVSLADLLNVD